MSSLRVYGRRDDQLKQRSVGAGGFLDHVDVRDAISLSTDRSDDAATIDIPDLQDEDVLEISLEDGLKIWTRWDDLQSDMAGQLVRGEGDELVQPSSLRLGRVRPAGSHGPGRRPGSGEPPRAGARAVSVDAGPRHAGRGR